MIPITVFDGPQGPWHLRLRRAVAHPGKWISDLSGEGPVYALMILFGLAMVDEMDRTAFGLLLPNIRDAFGLSNAGILTIVALASLVGLSLQVPIAQMADRHKRTRLMLIGAAVAAAFSIGTGLAVSVWMLVIVRSGFGIGQATVGPTHNGLLADWFPIGNRPRVFSFHRAANAIGAFVGPILAGVLAAGLSWRAPFIIFAIPMFVLILLGLRLTEPSRGIQERKAMGVTDALYTEEPPPSFAEGWRMVWKIESLRRMFYSLPFLAASLIGFSSLAAILYEQKFGLDEVQRGWVAAAAEPAQLVGLVIGARIGTKLMIRDPGLVIRFIAVVAFVTAGLLALFAFSPVVWMGVVINMAISASLAIVGPGVYASLSLAIPARARSLGFSMGAIFVIPGLVMLPIVGAIADSISIEVGMLAMVPVFLVGGLIIATAGNVIDRDIKQVWTMAAARSEVLYERRQGRVKLLLVRGLNVSYGNVQVLFDVDFEIDEGEIIALLGTNGAGKSTLLRSICGVVEADKGAVIFDGRDITHCPPNEIAAFGITSVPGGQGVFPTLTVAENLRVAGWLDRGKGAAAKARVDEVLELFPVLQSRLGEPAANLSGGQQQMLALGMAFLARPRLLLIDELSLGLAPVIVEQLLPIVERIRRQGTTVILVEQSVNLALTIAETAFFMEKGEIKFHGPTAELLERPDVLRSVFLEGAGSHPGGTPAVAGNGAAPVTANGSAPVVGADLSAAADGPMAPMAPIRSNGSVAPSVPDGSNGSVESGEPVGAMVAGGPEQVDGGRIEPVIPTLQVHDVTVRFGGIQAVGGVSLEIAPGEVVGIIGPNGAGKTTLFDLISGFTRADRGRIVLGGKDVTRSSPDKRARLGLGRSFQDARLFPALTVEETIAVALDRWVDIRDPLNAAFHLPASFDSEQAVQHRVDELIELLNLEAFRTKFVRELSTGSRRVVDLACVVAHHPSIVLLDEPSSGIAQREAEALGPLLVRIRDALGCSLIVIEHDMPLVTGISDRMVALDQGRVLVAGRPDEVLHDPEVIASYLGDTDAVIARSGSSTTS
jgi:ABC-type branched-subunit amino acid transport system ATPase component/sugar phosphate permease